MPLLQTMVCDGPECEALAACHYDPQTGWRPPVGWRTFDGGWFCSYLCISRYAANATALELRQATDALEREPLDDLPDGQRGEGVTMSARSREADAR